MSWRYLNIALAALSLFCGDARAEKTEIAVAQQFGISYLPLMLMEDQGLIEKHAKAEGLNVKVNWARLAGGGAMNDALLSRNIDIAVGGVPSLVLMWDKTRALLDVKGISALNSSPLLLNTRNPTVKSIRDLTAKDKIAITSAKVSSQAIILQMAAAQEFGSESFAKLDPLTVTMRHADAMTLLLAGTGDITAHFTSAPFQYQELRSDGIRTILNSKDIIGDATFIVTYTTGAFHKDNPRLYSAFLRATEEAIAIIGHDKSAAVAVYARMTKAKDAEISLLLGILGEPDFAFAMTPDGIMKYAEFMNSVGLIKSKPASWKDLFFENVHHLSGS